MIERYPDGTRLVAALAADLTATLASALQERGQASLVVPGGRTPQPLFERLRGAPLAWQNVWVTLGDERWVDPASGQSNEHLLRTSLLREHAAAASFVPLKNDAASPEEGAAAAWTALAQIPRPFDVVVLGMGEDGHFASLFPGAPQLRAALDAQGEPGCVGMHAPVDPRARLSLNLAALLDARRVILHVTGRKKLALLEGVLEGGSRQASAALPVSALLYQDRSPVEIHWSP